MIKKHKRKASANLIKKVANAEKQHKTGESTKQTEPNFVFRGMIARSAYIDETYFRNFVSDILTVSNCFPLPPQAPPYGGLSPAGTTVTSPSLLIFFFFSFMFAFFHIVCFACCKKKKEKIITKINLNFQ